MKADLRRLIKKLLQSGRMEKSQIAALLETLGDPESLTAEAVALALVLQHGLPDSLAQCRSWTPQEIELLSQAYPMIR